MLQKWMMAIFLLSPDKHFSHAACAYYGFFFFFYLLLVLKYWENVYHQDCLESATLYLFYTIESPLFLAGVH